MTPATQLFNIDRVRASFGEYSVLEKMGQETYKYQNNEFSSQGYLILSRREMHICEEFKAIPTRKELDHFLGCDALLLEMLVKTRSWMKLVAVVVHEWVKVLSGAFRGLLGKVVGLTAEEVDVHLPSQDLVEHLRIWELVREFRVGNCIRSQIGNSKTGAEMVRTGWVTKVSGSHVSVFDSVDSSEVCEHPGFNFPVLMIYRSPLLPSTLNFIKTKSLFLSGVPVGHQLIGRQ